MNRIKLGLLAGSEHPQVDSWSNDPGNECLTGEPLLPPLLSFEHSVFLPAHFESRYCYPVLFWLHDRGADHDQLVSVMPDVSPRNFIGVSIRGSCREAGGFGWKQSPVAIESVTNQVLELLDHVGSRYRINPDRIFVAGAGCGGTMAFRLAFHLPQLFCGVTSFNGGLPENLIPLVNLRSCRRVPVFWVHGRDSDDLTESRLCMQLKLLHIAGFDVTLRQYPGGNPLVRQPFSDLNTWMMEQIATQADSGIIL